MRVIVSIAVDIAAAIVSLAVIAVIIAMIVGAHRMMIIRPVLCADQRRRQSGHGESGKGKYCGLQKVLAHDFSWAWFKGTCYERPLTAAITLRCLRLSAPAYAALPSSTHKGRSSVKLQSLEILRWCKFIRPASPT
jgi:hypothetical protein